MLCLGRFQKGHPFLVLIWIFCPVAEFSNGQFGLFSPSSHSPLLAKFLERSRNSQNLCLPNRPVFNQSRRSWNSARWACATQPGLSPLCAQFRLGIPADGSSSLFLGLGYHGGPRGFWGHLVQARPGCASGSIISPIEPLNDADLSQVAVWGWNSSLF